MRDRNAFLVLRGLAEARHARQRCGRCCGAPLANNGTRRKKQLRAGKLVEIWSRGMGGGPAGEARRRSRSSYPSRGALDSPAGACCPRAAISVITALDSCHTDEGEDEDDEEDFTQIDMDARAARRLSHGRSHQRCIRRERCK